MLQLKQSLTSQFTFAFPEDSSVDRDHEDYNPQLYYDTFDLKHLPVKPGETMTKFHCRPLSRVALKRVMACDTVEAAETACAYGLKRVDGASESLHLEEDAQGRLTEKSLDRLTEVVGFEVVMRLGTVIQKRSLPSPF